MSQTNSPTTKVNPKALDFSNFYNSLTQALHQAQTLLAKSATATPNSNQSTITSPLVSYQLINKEANNTHNLANTDLASKLTIKQQLEIKDLEQYFFEHNLDIKLKQLPYLLQELFQTLQIHHHSSTELEQNFKNLPKPTTTDYQTWQDNRQQELIVNLLHTYFYTKTKLVDQDSIDHDLTDICSAVYNDLNNAEWYEYDKDFYDLDSDYSDSDDEDDDFDDGFGIPDLKAQILQQLQPQAQPKVNFHAHYQSDHNFHITHHTNVLYVNSNHDLDNTGGFGITGYEERNVCLSETDLRRISKCKTPNLETLGLKLTKTHCTRRLLSWFKLFSTNHKDNEYDYDIHKIVNYTSQIVEGRDVKPTCEQTALAFNLQETSFNEQDFATYIITIKQVISSLETSTNLTINFNGQQQTVPTQLINECVTALTWLELLLEYLQTLYQGYVSSLPQAEQSIKNFDLYSKINNRLLLELITNSQIAIGFSGGPDSVTLTILSYCLGLTPELIYCGHNFSEHTQAWGDYAQFLAKTLDLEMIYLNLDVSSQGNVEAKARQARYQAMFKHLATKHYREQELANFRMFAQVPLAYIRGKSYSDKFVNDKLYRKGIKLFLGHQLNDQIEQYLRFFHQNHAQELYFKGIKIVKDFTYSSQASTYNLCSPHYIQNLYHSHPQYFEFDESLNHLFYHQFNNGRYELAVGYNKDYTRFIQDATNPSANSHISAADISYNNFYCCILDNNAETKASATVGSVANSINHSANNSVKKSIKNSVDSSVKNFTSTSYNTTSYKPTSYNYTQELPIQTLRPLLHSLRQTIMRGLAGLEIPVVFDPMNIDDKYERVQYRHYTQAQPQIIDLVLTHLKELRILQLSYKTNLKQKIIEAELIADIRPCLLDPVNYSGEYGSLIFDFKAARLFFNIEGYQIPNPKYQAYEHNFKKSYDSYYLGLDLDKLKALLKSKKTNKLQANKLQANEVINYWLEVNGIGNLTDTQIQELINSVVLARQNSSPVFTFKTSDITDKQFYIIRHQGYLLVITAYQYLTNLNHSDVNTPATDNSSNNRTNNSTSDNITNLSSDTKNTHDTLAHYNQVFNQHQLIYIAVPELLQKIYNSKVIIATKQAWLVKLNQLMDYNNWKMVTDNDDIEDVWTKKSLPYTYNLSHSLVDIFDQILYLLPNIYDKNSKDNAMTYIHKFYQQDKLESLSITLQINETTQVHLGYADIYEILDFYFALKQLDIAHYHFYSVEGITDLSAPNFTLSANKEVSKALQSQGVIWLYKNLLAHNQNKIKLVPILV